MTESELDKALMAPLPEIADAGFSQRVLVKAFEEKARRERNAAFVIAAVATLICAVMPFTPFGQAVDDWAIGFGRDLSSAALRAVDLSVLSVPLVITAGALTVALLVAQYFPAQR